MATTRAKIIREMQLRLGHQMVDVELDPEHFDLAIDLAIEKFKQRSGNSVEEKFIELELKENVTEYVLPDQVVEVSDVYRRGSGLSTTTGADIEPFEAQYMNSYLMQSGAMGGLALYDALAQHRELLARMFGAEILFTWNTATKTLFIHRKMRATDMCYLHAWIEKDETMLFKDIYALPWLKSYSLAQSKLMLAQARSKFSQIAGPQGGTTLNGDALAQDALQEIEKLEDELLNFIDGSGPAPIVIG